jgi:hypothetical protein
LAIVALSYSEQQEKGIAEAAEIEEKRRIEVFKLNCCCFSILKFKYKGGRTSCDAFSRFNC